MAARDRRVTLMNEVLSSIRMIKFYAFEKPFETRVLKAREDELSALRKNFWLEVSFQGCVLFRPSPPPCFLVSQWETRLIIINVDMPAVSGLYHRYSASSYLSGRTPPRSS